MTWQQEGNGGLAVATIGFFLLEWWSTAGAAVLSERVGGVEIRQLERTDLHELPDIWVVWTEKKVQALRSEEKLRGRPFHARSTLRERLDTSQARRHITGLPSSYNKSRRSCNLLVETIKHSRISTSRQALCRLLWSRGAHEADETRGESSQQSAHWCACARGVEEIVGTTAHRAEDAAESSTTSEEGAGECERRRATSAEERRGSKRCVHVGTIRQGASGPRSSKTTVRAVHTRARSPQCSHRSLRHTPSAAAQTSWTVPSPHGTKPRYQQSQTSRVHTHQLLAWSVFSSWDSDRRSGRPAQGIRWVRRGVQANALDGIAGRRVGQISKEAHDLQSARKQRKNSPQACPLEIPLWRDKECRASSTA